MPRFLTGDELGNIKSVRYTPDVAEGEAKSAIKTLYNGKSSGVQVLAITPRPGGSQSVAAGFSDGSASSFILDDGAILSEVQSWKETRLKDGHRYIGLTISEQGVFSCTSNGALRLTPTSGNEGEPTPPRLASLPTRLQDWRMSSSRETFAYGGDEVDISVWDTERAFQSSPQDARIESAAPKKRKRDSLFPGEIWRAKNVHNDNLGLRQPIRVTSLTYLAPSSATHHIIAGTQFGDLRRYDTRAARRPVSDWKVGKVGGIKAVVKGMSEHEVFTSDHGSNLYALDLRNGRVIYGYKGLSGAVNSIAPSPNFLASTALDRYTRIHSTFPPPVQAGQHQDRKGEVLDKVFMKSTPTVVVWDQDKSTDESPMKAPEDDDVWETMENVNTDSDEETSTHRKKNRNIL